MMVGVDEGVLVLAKIVHQHFNGNPNEIELKLTWTS